MNINMTTTTFTLPGYKIKQNLGVVRGITVRARWIGSQIVAGLRTLGGGQITEYIELCEVSRAEAFDYMVNHADEIGANAIIGVRYDTTELGQNMSEVICYGTAVIVEPE